MAEASRWKEETINGWINKGEQARGNLMERAEGALKEAEEKEEAEAKIRIMESQCEELAGLAAQAGKQIPAEAEVGCSKNWRRKWTKGRRWWGTWVGP